VEGFCGSGIQIGLLQEGLAERLPPAVRVLVIHALNPYGFSHLRRVNEDNIDLNRNFVDYSNSYRANDDYDVLSDAIDPSAESPLHRTASHTQLDWKLLR
jgi:predicted deacylase